MRPWKTFKTNAKDHLFRREIVARRDLLVQLLDVGEAGDDADGAPVGLLAMELQLGLLHAPGLGFGVGPRRAIGGARGFWGHHRGRRRRLRRALSEQRHGCGPSVTSGRYRAYRRRARAMAGRDDRTHTCAGDDCRTARCSDAVAGAGTMAGFRGVGVSLFEFSRVRVEVSVFERSRDFSFVMLVCRVDESLECWMLLLVVWSHSYVFFSSFND